MLSWNMSPDSFVAALSVWASAVRRETSPGPAGRRFVNSVRRRRRKWFMRVNRLTSLPALPLSLRATTHWQLDDPVDLQIVIPPQVLAGADGGPDAVLDDAARRKWMRRLIRRVRKSVKLEPIVLVSADRPRQRLPKVARTHGLGRAEVRTLYLDSLGIAIMPKLSADEVAAFHAAGAGVLANDEVLVEEPSYTPVTADAGEHLESIDWGDPARRAYTGKGIRIGVLDTGIDAKHPEFLGKKIRFMAFTKRGDRADSKVMDYGCHGTHVSALIAGRTVGIAPDADLAVAAVIFQTPKGPVGLRAQLTAGANWLARGTRTARPVDLINASLGSMDADFDEHNTFHDLRQKGILTIASIGNAGLSGIGHHIAPGMYDCVLAVGAIDQAGLVYDNSSWGPALECGENRFGDAHKPDLVAPGVGVLSAVSERAYARMTGTSMAAPIVTGAAALLLEKDPKLRRNPDELCKTIFETLVKPLPEQPSGHDIRQGGRGQLSLASL